MPMFCKGSMDEKPFIVFLKNLYISIRFTKYKLFSIVLFIKTESLLIKSVTHNEKYRVGGKYK